jgi:hypothetical protein
MRTGLFLLAGFLLLASAAILAKLFSGHHAEAPTWLTVAFLGIWFGLTGFNLWVGVSKAGYSFMEELPIWLLLFGVPAVAGLLLRWKVS